MISIIIPVYNAATFLDQCLQSILDQSYSDWECIVVDDGSTDSSGVICDNWGKKDDRFVIVHQVNQGVSAARNQGLAKSRGEYICFVDSDDWVEPSYLSHLFGGLINDNIDMVVSGFIHEGKESEIVKPKDDVCITLTPSDSQRLIENINFLYSPWGILNKSSIIKGIKILFPSDMSFGEDMTFNYQYLRHVKQINFLAKADYHYRIQNGIQTLSYRFGEANTFTRYDLWKMRESFYKGKGMWNHFSQADMYKELWSIVYDGIFSTHKPSLPFLKRLLGIPEIACLKDWESLFPVSNWIKSGIENRAYRFFYLFRIFF